MMADTNELIHIAEYEDEDGPYCVVYTDSQPDGIASYDNLEAAAWAIVGAGYQRGRTYKTLVHVVPGPAGDAEYARYTTAERAAINHYERLERINRAPRDKRTGRPLFVSY